MVSLELMVLFRLLPYQESRNQQGRQIYQLLLKHPHKFHRVRALIVLSAICKEIIVGVTSPKLSLLNIVRGIKFILAHKSHRASEIDEPSMSTGIVKLPNSFIFWGNVLCKIALQFSVSKIVSSKSLSFLLLDRISFMNLA